MGLFSFPKKERLLNREDFVNLHRSGERYATAHFLVTLRWNGLGFTRLGLIVGKKAGKAVKRNRIKRLIRECFRLNKPKFPQGYDIGVNAKKNVGYLDLRKTEEDLEKLFLQKKFRR